MRWKWNLKSNISAMVGRIIDEELTSANETKHSLPSSTSKWIRAI
jgi:hypothetical protein